MRRLFGAEVDVADKCGGYDEACVSLDENRVRDGFSGVALGW